MKTPETGGRSLYERLSRPVAIALIGGVAFAGCSSQREPSGPTKIVKAEKGDTLRDIVNQECGTLALLPPELLFIGAKKRIMELEGNEFDPEKPLPTGTPVIFEESTCAESGYPTE